MRAILDEEVKSRIINKFPFSFCNKTYKKSFKRKHINQVAKKVKKFNDQTIDSSVSEIVEMVENTFHVKSGSIWISRKMANRKNGILDITYVDNCENGKVGYFKINLDRFSVDKLSKRMRLMDYHECDIASFLSSKAKLRF